MPASNYTMRFTPKAYQKFWLYIDKATGEISGLGHVTFDPFTDSFLIDDLALLEQTNGGANTVMSGAGLSKFMLELDKSGGNPAEWRLWWHSHVDFQAFWSGTDIATINDFDTEQVEANWFLSIVGNKKREFKTRLDVFQPFRYTFDDLSVEEVPDEEVEKIVDAEMAAKIIVPPAVVKPVFQGDRKNKNNGKAVAFKTEVAGDDDIVEDLKEMYWDEYKRFGYTPYSKEEYNGIVQTYGNNVATQVFYRGTGTNTDKWYPICSGRNYDGYNPNDRYDD